MRIMKCLAIFLLYFGVNLCENGIEFTHETQLYKPFFEVVVSGDEKAVQDLINNGADVNKADETLSAPIHFAANAGFDRIVGLLIQNNANINTVNKDGYSPLHFASVKGHEKVAALLIQSGADVDIANKFGETPLHHAANNGYGGIVNLLLQNSANVNATNKLGDTALHFASNKGHEDIVNKLIENGINVNVANNNSDTALHLASVNSNGKTNIVKVLLQNNANQSIRNKNGKLPIDLASKAGHLSIVEALQGFSLTEKACEVYSKRITDRILRGEIADTTDFPWTVALGYINDEYHINFECTGTIISEYFILTAANCISTTHRPVVVRVGKSAVIDGRTNRRKNYNIVDIIRHPNYSLETKKHDIALVKVSRPIEFTDTVRPACLQTDLKDKNPDVNLVVSGWQVDSKQDTNSTDGFFYTNVTTVSLSDCNRTFSDMNKSQDVFYLQNGVDESQYCAHDPVGLKHTCESHYGAPLQIISNVVNKVKVVGIISFGSICGTTLPAVYTRVAYYLNWIEAIVWPNGIASE